ncbi:MAG: hypothetical protein H7829_03550 [Magnetococcus sp. THC-1_WYH]
MANEAQWGSLPFEEAIRFFRGKVNMPSEHWDDFLKDTHNTAFVVAGATKADLLNDIRLAVDQGISQGTTLQISEKSLMLQWPKPDGIIKGQEIGGRE